MIFIRCNAFHSGVKVLQRGSMQNKCLSTSSSSINFQGTIKNTQRKYHISKEMIRQDTFKIQELLGVEDFAIDIWFCSEPKIRELNHEWRGKRKSTDVLSFPACDFDAPGIFADDPTLEFEKHLGDIVIAPAYVERQLLRDQEAYNNNQLDISEDRGVSKAMANQFSLEERYKLLIIHSVIHLLGYDHEEEDEWIEMTNKEDEILQKLLL